MEDYVRLREVKKIYKMGEVEIAAADGIDFSVGKENLQLLSEQVERERLLF